MAPLSDVIVALGDGDVKHGPVLIEALETDHLVVVLDGPGLLGLDELGRDALAAEVGEHAAKPRKVGCRHQLESDSEADMIVLEQGHEQTHVVAALETPGEEGLVVMRRKHIVVQTSNQTELAQANRNHLHIRHDTHHPNFDAAARRPPVLLLSTSRVPRDTIPHCTTHG